MNVLLKRTLLLDLAEGTGDQGDAEQGDVVGRQDSGSSHGDSVAGGDSTKQDQTGSANSA